MDFFQFCACGPSGYARLKQKVDACARLGRSYEFAGCTLPSGCNPAQAQAGFWRTGEDYLLYFRPAVAYGGADPRLNEFFLRVALQRYAGFQAMTDCLRGLDSAFTAPKPDLFRTLKEAFQDRVLGQEAAVDPANLIDSRRFQIKAGEITITVKPELSGQVEARVLEGRKYILIPAGEGVEVNGLAVELEAQPAGKI